MKSKTKITYLVAAVVSGAAFAVMVLTLVPQDDGQAGMAFPILGPLCAAPAAFAIALWQPFGTKRGGGGLAATVGVGAGALVVAGQSGNMSLGGSLYFVLVLTPWVVLGAIVASAIGAALRYAVRFVQRRAARA